MTSRKQARWRLLTEAALAYADAEPEQMDAAEKDLEIAAKAYAREVDQRQRVARIASGARWGRNA